MIPLNDARYSWTHYFHYDLEIVKRLHKFGIELDFLNRVGGYFNSTPLYASAFCGYIDTVKYYLEIGADPTIPDDVGVSPIENVYEEDNIEMVKLLASPETILMKTFDDPKLNIYEIALRDGNAKYIELFESVLGKTEK